MHDDPAAPQQAPGADGAAPAWNAAELGRLLSRIENDPAERARVLAELPVPTNAAHRIGITGSPGVGKSTLLARLVPLLSSAATAGGRKGSAGVPACDSAAAEGRPTVPAVLAVDPTSALSGGAVLADRYRWPELARAGVFIRSLASRGSLGGLSAATGAAARVLEAAGYDPIVIETVGAGQTGFEVLGLADTVVVLFSPESGDALQLLKAGLLEVGDIFAVNKSDRPGADTMLADLRGALETGSRGVSPPTTAEQRRRDISSGTAEHARRDAAATADWQPPALALCAEDGSGVTELAAALAAHRDWLAALPAEHPRRLRRLRAELEYEVRALADTAVVSALHNHGAELLEKLRDGRITLAEAAAAVVRSLRTS